MISSALKQQIFGRSALDWVRLALLTSSLLLSLFCGLLTVISYDTINSRFEVVSGVLSMLVYMFLILLTIFVIIWLAGKVKP